jgi:hypothetical protein
MTVIQPSLSCGRPISSGTSPEELVGLALMRNANITTRISGSRRETVDSCAWARRFSSSFDPYSVQVLAAKYELVLLDDDGIMTTYRAWPSYSEYIFGEAPPKVSSLGADVVDVGGNGCVDGNGQTNMVIQTCAIYTAD